MKIAIWNTGHEIADTVAQAILEGLPHATLLSTNEQTTRAVPDFDCHIAYGILRGTAEVFAAAKRYGIPYFCIDRGYFNPGHYQGYYRISSNGTQQTYGLNTPNYERMKKLNITVDLTRLGAKTMICAPTDAVCSLFAIDKNAWIKCALEAPYSFLRFKGSPVPLSEDLGRCGKVITFNSAVGWEAARLGIPVESDPTHSIVGAYQKSIDTQLHVDLQATRKLFAIMAGLQLTLQEIRQGMLWPLMQSLLEFSSVGILEKQSVVTSPPIASIAAHNIP